MIEKDERQHLEQVWNYMVLNEPYPKCDLIMGCGCANLTIPITCSDLFKQGFGKNILFAGGLGKLTKELFLQPEAEVYKKIAIEQGISPEHIVLEKQSTNTGDNFRLSIPILEQNKIPYDSILIVHNRLSERRTLSAAKAIIPNKKIYITSGNITFDTFMKRLETRTDKEIHNIISVMIGDIQRMVVYPQFGWQVRQDVSDQVLESYFYLKQKGYNTYIIPKDQISHMIEQYGIVENETPNYFT